MDQIALKNGCKCSRPTVSPASWEKDKVIKGHWKISYRFYDPAHDTPKQVVIKGMNHFKDIKQRREATRNLLTYEMNLLLNEGYNPFSKTVAPESSHEIAPDTPLYIALGRALKRLKIEPKTAKDIENVLKPFKKALDQLDLLDLPVKEVRKRHIKFALEQCAKNSKRFTANTFNHYRKYLSMLFVELLDLDAVELNPVALLKKEKTVQKIRKTLTAKEREKVKEHLQDYPAFYRFVQIFFHSGARISELLQLKAGAVDLSEQRYKCIIKKGKQYREVNRTIKDIALPYWMELLKGSNDDDYIFSKGLKPGLSKIRPDQITKRWSRLVMQPLKIKATFYSLKHLQTTELVDLLSVQDAAKLNAHTTDAMVVKIYDTGKEKRQHERIRKANNEF